jgi:hypothetical protein
MPAPFPVRSQSPYGGAVKAYIDEQTDYSFATAPGAELAYAARTTNFTTTNINSASATGDIPALVCTTIGTGRPVEVLFSAAAVYHSVANTLVAVSLLCNDSATDVNGSGLGSQQSTLTNAGPNIVVRRRTLPLTIGVSYSFKARVWLAAAGTGTLAAATNYPIELSLRGC